MGRLDSRAERTRLRGLSITESARVAGPAPLPPSWAKRERGDSRTAKRGGVLASGNKGVVERGMGQRGLGWELGCARRSRLMEP